MLAVLYCSLNESGNVLVNAPQGTTLLSANETQIFNCANEERLPGGRKMSHATCVANVPRHLAKFSVSPLTCQG